MKNIKEKNQEELEQTGQVEQISAEVLDHMMNPRNYKTMEDADGVGMAVDNKTGEFAIVYIKVEDENLEDISFGINACQDTLVAGSLFTEMIKKDSIENGLKAMKIMDEKLLQAPKKQRVCSLIILEAFKASVQNYKNRQNGIDEEHFQIDLRDSCEGVNLG